MSQPEQPVPATAGIKPDNTSCALCGKKVQGMLRKACTCIKCGRLKCPEHMSPQGLCKECMEKLPPETLAKIQNIRRQAVLFMIPGMIFLVIGMMLLIWNMTTPVECHGLSCMSAITDSTNRSLLCTAVSLIGMCFSAIGPKVATSKVQSLLQNEGITPQSPSTLREYINKEKQEAI